MFRIRSLLCFDWTCPIRFRSVDDARGYARRNNLSSDFFGGQSRFVVVKVDEFGNENSYDRWEI